MEESVLYTLKIVQCNSGTFIIKTATYNSSVEQYFKTVED